ncbi:MoxR family ATPase [Planctomycetota bacterium]|nr:MoxR family ATPase [Planctomycetota bacterium]
MSSKPDGKDCSDRELDKSTQSLGDHASGEDVEALIARISGLVQGLRDQVSRVVVGQDEVIEQLFISLFTRGHAVLIGVPGLAKTLLVSTVAKALHLDFSRIQFTPDLMPSDITGTEVIDEKRGDDGQMRRELRFIPGPVFANVILADEINRTPPKTQSALLEAMQERQVTVSGQRHGLPDPFFVLATQNPIEQEGTYPLPEAQLDRFMFMIKVGYPNVDEELEIIKRTTGKAEADVETVVTAEDVRQIQSLVREVPIADHVMKYAVNLVRATRREESGEISDEFMGVGLDFIDRYLQWGAGPRASQNLILAGKARAILCGRIHVSAEDIAAVAKPVLRHRLILNFNAEAEGITADDLIEQLLSAISPDGQCDPRLDAIMK